MTPDDLAALLRWLYANDDGGGWLPAAARNLRLNERNLRGMLQGKVAIPDDIGRALIWIAVGHSTLNAWQDNRPSLLSVVLSDRTQLALLDAARLFADANPA